MICFLIHPIIEDRFQIPAYLIIIGFCKNTGNQDLMNKTAKSFILIMLEKGLSLGQQAVDQLLSDIGKGKLHHSEDVAGQNVRRSR